MLFIFDHSVLLACMFKEFVSTSTTCDIKIYQGLFPRIHTLGLLFATMMVLDSWKNGQGDDHVD